MAGYIPSKQGVNTSNFAAAAKMIELGNLQPSLIQNVVKQQLQKNRLRYAFPALVGNALIHRDAYKFGYSQSRRGQPPRVCPCCLERVETEDIGICYDTTKIDIQSQMGYAEFKLTTGISLFFSFVKMLIVYLIFRFLVCDAFNLLTNIIGGSYCQDAGQTECDNTLWNFLSIFNKKNNKQFILIQDILNLVLIVLSIGFFFFYRKKQYGKARILNDRNQVEEDYAILVQQIPLIDFPSKADAKRMRVNQAQVMELYHRQHLWRFFETKVRLWLDKRRNWINQKGNNQADFYHLISKNNGQLRSAQIVKSVSLCYNLQRLQTLQKERSELINNRIKYQKLRKQIQSNPQDSSLRIQQIQSDNRFASVPNQVEFLNDCQVILNKQYASDNSVLFNITHFVGKAFISFQYQHYMQYILEQADRNINFLVFNGSRLKVSRVSNPRDIYWHNLRHSREKQNKKIFSTISLLLLCLLVCLGLLCGAEYGRIRSQQMALKSQTSPLAKYGQFGFASLKILIILLINRVIASISRKKTKQQCHYSKSQQSESIIYKTIIFQFINTAILPFVVTRIFSTNIADRSGLIFQMMQYIVINALLVLGLSIIFPKSILRSCVHMCRYRRSRPEDSVQKFQIQLNQDFQYVEFDIIGQYINYILLVFVASFYAYLIPAAIPFLAIVFFFQFWVDKINLFRRCSHPRKFSFNLTRNVLKVFQASIWIFALGVFIFGIYIHGTALHIFGLVGLAISTLYLWFLFGSSIRMERKLFGSYQSSSSLNYDDCMAEGKFQETYWTSNPATCLVKESDVTGRQNILNPALNKIFITTTKIQ